MPDKARGCLRDRGGVPPARGRPDLTSSPLLPSPSRLSSVEFMYFMAPPEHCKMTGDLDSEHAHYDRLKLFHIIEVVHRYSVPAFHGLREHALGVHKTQFRYLATAVMLTTCSAMDVLNSLSMNRSGSEI